MNSAAIYSGASSQEGPATVFDAIQNNVNKTPGDKATLMLVVTPFLPPP